MIKWYDISCATLYFVHAASGWYKSVLYPVFMSNMLIPLEFLQLLVSFILKKGVSNGRKHGFGIRNFIRNRETCFTDRLPHHEQFYTLFIKTSSFSTFNFLISSSNPFRVIGSPLPCTSLITYYQYVEIKYQLDATEDFYCRSYCLLSMFRAPLCPSSGAREYYTGGCCLWYLVHSGARNMLSKQ